VAAGVVVAVLVVVVVVAVLVVVVVVVVVDELLQLPKWRLLSYHMPPYHKTP